MAFIILCILFALSFANPTCSCEATMTSQVLPPFRVERLHQAFYNDKGLHVQANSVYGGTESVEVNRCQVFYIWKTIQDISLEACGSCTPRPVTTFGPLDNPLSACSSNMRLHKNFHLIPQPPNCGPVFKEPMSKIMGGKNARVGEFPWMATIYKENVHGPGLKTMFCDGSIVTSQYVLSAAHCLQPHLKMKRYHLYVRVGEYDVKNYSDSNPQEIRVVAVLIHDKYSTRTNVNDIGLLRLQTNIQFNKKTVQPICLPFTCDIVTMDLSNKLLVLAGWGLKQEKPFPVQTGVLQKILVRTVPHADCQKSWGEQLTVDRNHICVQGSNSFLPSVCQGDSGGPLMLNVNQSTYVVGVVSLGDSCDPSIPSESPNVIANVAAYVHWILLNIY